MIFRTMCMILEFILMKKRYNLSIEEGDIFLMVYQNLN